MSRESMIKAKGAKYDEMVTGEFKKEFGLAELAEGNQRDLQDLLDRKDFWIQEYGADTYHAIIASYQELTRKR